MEYRNFGRLDWRASALGFGCMRLPILDGDSGRIDEPEATRMVRYAIDHGVNYLDTAYGYHQGNSERFLGRALQDGYRQRIHLATKLPSWLVKTADDFDRLLNEQLGKLQTDHIDCYLLHGLGAERWRDLDRLGVLRWAESAIADGRIRHLGFSFHDTFEAFQEIVDAYEGWALCQIQYNYMDVENQAGTRGLKYAASKGLAVVVMEPLLGGRLVKAPPAVQRFWDTAETRRAPADWALQWLWSQPEVSVVLSGMSTMQQVQENVASASQLAPLNSAEMRLVEQVRAAYKDLSVVPCTRCEYCLPCPTGLNIPRLFDLLNSAVMYDAFDEMRRVYRQWVPEDQRAGKCAACQECESKCPQHIAISEWMPRVHQVLGEGRDLATVI